MCKQHFPLFVRCTSHLILGNAALNTAYLLFFRILSYNIFNSVCWSRDLVNGPTSKRPASDDGRCTGQLLMMWSAVCSGSPHSHAARSARPHFLMDALHRPTPVRILFRVVQTVFSTQFFPLDAFSWVRYVAMYSGGSGCFPLLFPRCRNPCILRPVLRDDTQHLLSLLVVGFTGLESAWRHFILCGVV